MICFSEPPPDLAAGNWPAPGEEMKQNQSNRSYLQSRVEMEEQEERDNKKGPKGNILFDHSRNSANQSQYGARSNYYQNNVQTNTKEYHQQGGGRDYNNSYDSYRGGQSNGRSSYKGDVYESRGHNNYYESRGKEIFS